MPFLPAGVELEPKPVHNTRKRPNAKAEPSLRTPKAAKKKRGKLAKTTPEALERARSRKQATVRTTDVVQDSQLAYASTQESISATPDDLTRSLKKRKRVAEGSVIRLKIRGPSNGDASADLPLDTSTPTSSVRDSKRRSPGHVVAPDQPLFDHDDESKLVVESSQTECGDRLPNIDRAPIVHEHPHQGDEVNDFVSSTFPAVAAEAEAPDQQEAHHTVTELETPIQVSPKTETKPMGAEAVKESSMPDMKPPADTGPHQERLDESTPDRAVPPIKDVEPLMTIMNDRALDCDQIRDLVHASLDDSALNHLRGIPPCQYSLRLRNMFRSVSKRFMKDEHLDHDEFVSYLSKDEDGIMDFFWQNIETHRELQVLSNEELREIGTEIYPNKEQMLDLFANVQVLQPDNPVLQDEPTEPQLVAAASKPVHSPSVEAPGAATTLQVVPASISDGKILSAELHTTTLDEPRPTSTAESPNLMSSATDPPVGASEPSLQGDEQIEMAEIESGLPSFVLSESDQSRSASPELEVLDFSNNSRAGVVSNSKLTSPSPTVATVAASSGIDVDNAELTETGGIESESPSIVLSENRQSRTPAQIPGISDTPTSPRTEVEHEPRRNSLFVDESDVDPEAPDYTSIGLDLDSMNTILPKTPQRTYRKKFSLSSARARRSLKYSDQITETANGSAPAKIARPADRTAEDSDSSLLDDTERTWRAFHAAHPGFVFRRGPLSPVEVDIARKAVDDYKEDQNLSDQEFRDLLHDKSCRYKRSLWSALIYCIPERKPKNMREYLKKLYIPFTDRNNFNDEEKEKLEKLVEEYGHAWATIGKLMGRYREDCQHMYLRMKEKEIAKAVKHGLWTAAENTLYRQALDSPPEDGTPIWKHVSDVVGTRTPVQCFDHHRIHTRTDKSYKRVGSESPNDRTSKPRVSFTTSKKRKSLGTPKSVRERGSPGTKKARPPTVELSASDTLRLVEYLLSQEVHSLDELPTDLGEFERYGERQISSRLATERKKVRQWRSMDTKAILEHMQSNLEARARSHRAPSQEL